MTQLQAKQSQEYEDDSEDADRAPADRRARPFAASHLQPCP
jgi:hypothetical protein